MRRDALAKAVHGTSPARSIQSGMEDECSLGMVAANGARDETKWIGRTGHRVGQAPE
jgi:hypothetical protein